jgi:thioredoxin 1
MHALLIILLVLSAFVLMMQLSIYVRAQSVRGRPAPDTASVDGEAAGFSRRVYYFFGRNCGPCKAMAPTIERIMQGNPNLVRIDVAEHLELARDFGVRATPTFMVVENGVIRKVKLGGMREYQLLALLKPPD